MHKMEPKQTPERTELELELDRLVATSREEGRATLIGLFSEMAALEAPRIQYISRPAYNSAD
jgi:hypothetical protein